MISTLHNPLAIKPMEHRWGARVPLDLPVLLRWSDAPRIAGRLRNASVSGGLIELDEHIAVCAAIDVEIAAGPRGRKLDLPACVVRAGLGYIAVEWRDMGEPALVELLRESCEAEFDPARRDGVFG